jgi:TPR repeat protein
MYRFCVFVVVFGLATMPLVYAQNSQTAEKKKEVEELIIKANKGDAASQFWLGIHYSASKDYSQAIFWYRKAADQGWTVAFGQIGECYEFGFGVEKNLAEAANWYLRASSKGDTTSMYRLGRCYYEGLGVEQDYEAAVLWFRRAADAGNPTAQRSLGDCYAKGLGVAQSKFNAQFLYYKSFQYFYQRLSDNLAVFEDAPYRYMTGMHYEKGIGVRLDLIEAYAYYASMAERSDDRSKAAMVDLSTLLSESEIAAGKKRAIELQKEIEAKRAGNRSIK